MLTARHATSTWEYYIGNTWVALFNDGGRQPGSTVSHTVNLGGFSGRQKVLAIWKIADTANAFYNCVDLQIGGGNPSPTPTPTVTPTSTPTPTVTPPPPAAPGEPASSTPWAPRSRTAERATAASRLTPP